MLKKRAVFLISALLILQCVVPGYASKGSASSTVLVVSAYYTRDHVYCCVQPGDSKTDISSVSAGVTSNDGSIGEMREPKAVGGGDRSVNYMLLVDGSTSMVGYRTRLIAFADALLQTEQQEVQITVATIGKTFAVVDEGLNGSDQVRQALNKISYTQQLSDISGGVTDALAYLSVHTEAGGAICNLVVLTDGEVYLPSTGGSATKKAANEAEQAIEQTSEVIVHTVGFGTWEAATFKALSSGTGLDLSSSDRGSAEKAGRSIAQFVDSLYYMDLPFKAGQNTEFLDAQLMLSIPSSGDLELVPIRSLRNLDYVRSSSSNSPPVNNSEVPEPGSDDDMTEPENGENAPDSPAQDEGADGSADADEEESDAPGISTTKDPSEDERHGAISNETANMMESSDTPERPWTLIVAGVAVALVVAACVVLGRNRKRGHDPADAEKNSVRIRLEILSGSGDLHRADYQLAGELIIGNGSACDIVFADETVSGRNSRIYLRDGVVYIEDLNSHSNTYIGGMKIHAPNQLRSGDEVMIGQVQFRVEF